MKHLLRVLLLVLCCCLVFTACDFGGKKNPDGDQQQNDKFTKESVEADPLAAILKAMGNTAAFFATDDAEIGETVNAAMLNGSFGVDLNNAMLLETMKMSDVALEIHSRESGEAVFAVKGEMANGQKIDSYIYVTNEKLAVGSELFESMLEIDPAYTLTFSDLENEEWMNGLAGLFDEYTGGAESGATTTASGLLQQVFGKMEDMMGNAGQGMDTKWLVDAINGLDPTVTEKNGVITVSYELTIDKLVDMAEDIVDTMPDDLLEMFTMYVDSEVGSVDMDADAIRDMIEEGLDYLDVLIGQSGVDAEVTLNVGLNVETSRLNNMSFDGDVKMNGQKMADFDMEATYTDGGVKNEIEIDVSGQKIEGVVEFKKTTTDSKVTYALALEVEMDMGYGSDSKVEVGGEVKYTYEKNGDFAVEVEIAMPSDTNMSFELEGKVTKTDKSVTISFDEFSGSALPAAFENIGTIWFDAGSALPAFPTNATNVKDMTLDEIEALMKKAGMVKPLYGTYESESALGISGVYHFYGTSYSFEVTFETEDGYTDYDYVHGTITAREDNSITLEYTEWEYDDETGVGEEVTRTETYTFEKGEGYIKINGVTYTEVDNSGLEG